MKKTAINLDKLIQDFSFLEQITELKGKNNMLEIKLDETSRILKFSQSKENNLAEERECLLGTIKILQNNLQQQFDLRVENDKLKSTVHELKTQNKAQEEEKRACIKRLETELRALRDQHQREMDDCAKETLNKLKTKDAEMKEALDKKESTLEEMRRKMKDLEKEKQSEIIKLQMEFSAKLARAQSVSITTHQQPHNSGFLPQNIFKRKLQFLQEEKNKEIETLRQRVKELEQQNLPGLPESRLKRRKN